MSRRNKGNHYDLSPELTDAEKLLLKEGRKKANVKINGKVEYKSKLELVTAQAFNTAISGSPHALNQVMRLTREAEAKEVSFIKTQITFAQMWKANQTQKVEECITKGLDVSTVLPNPDDIIIDYNQGYQIVGPIDEEELEKVHHTCKLRDTLLLQHALEERMEWPKDTYSLDEPTYPGSAMLLANLINDTLPERFKLTDIEIINREIKHARESKRALLSLCVKAWRSIKLSKKRGWRTPPFKQTEALLCLTLPKMQELLSVDASKLDDNSHQASVDILQIINNRYLE